MRFSDQNDTLFPPIPLLYNIVLTQCLFWLCSINSNMELKLSPHIWQTSGDVDGLREDKSEKYDTQI